MRFQTQNQGSGKFMPQQQNIRLQKNNFDLLRLLFAGTVCLVHAYQLSGYQTLSWLADVLSSEAAVKSFFVVSGFLIFMSFERSSSLSSYASKRIRRIYPAYATIILIAAFGLVFVSTKGVKEYFSMEWVKYVAFNLVFLNFLQPSLPGVFESNIFTAANGALWTLKIEAMFYIAVPIIVYLFKILPRIWVLAGGYLLSIAYFTGFNILAAKTGNEAYAILGRQLPGQLSYFLGGAFFYYYLPFFEKYAYYFLGGASLLLAVHHFFPLPLLEPIALSTVVIFFGLFFYAGEFGKYGDFSYGVYILHSPILQIFVQYGWFREKPWLYLITGLSITILAAIALWHGVEKRFLLRNSHYLEKATAK